MVTLKKMRVFITTLIFLLALGILGGFLSSASAATVGDQLLQPEEGWKRYDASHSLVNATGTIGTSPDFTNYYNGTGPIWVQNSTSKMSFEFKGTKLRLIGSKYSNRTTAEVYVDGILKGIYNQYNASTLYQRLDFELTGLKDTIHFVEIKPTTDNFYIDLDAIDIDSNGFLVSPLELAGDINDNVNSLSWNEIGNATGYNVKRATTVGGPYTTIASELTTNSYIDSNIENRVTYYYVVSAIFNEIESKNSNEVALTREGEEPAPQPEPSGNAKLTLYLVDNQIKEYEVTLVEVDKFISWFDNRMSGTGQAYYVFELKHNISPYKTIKEYMVFDKIVWYEVKEY